MKILVSCKRVEDPDAYITLTSDQLDIDRDDVDYKINPFCEIAVEAAIRLKEDFGGEVVAVCIGSDEAQKELRTALAMGADRGILIEADERTIDADLVSRLFEQIVKEEEPDLVLMGKQATDGDSCAAAQMLAARLDWPQATFACALRFNGDLLEVDREADGGIETLALPLPAVVTADLRLNEPRYPSLPNIMKAKRKPLDCREMEDFDIDLQTQTETISMSLPNQRTAGVRVKSVEELVQRLIDQKCL